MIVAWQPDYPCLPWQGRFGRGIARDKRDALGASEGAAAGADLYRLRVSHTKGLAVTPAG
jgi:hypothetical protein